MTVLQDLSFPDANLNQGSSIHDRSSVYTNSDGETFYIGSAHYWSTAQNTTVCTLFIQAYNADGSPSGDIVLVNTQVTNNIFYVQSAAILENGNFVLLWQEADGDTVSQIFSEDGTAVSELTEVDTAADGTIGSYTQKATALDNGGYVVTFRELVAADTYRLAAQIYDADGKAAGDAFVLTPDTDSNNSSTHSVAVVDGGFVVTMTSYAADSDGSAGVIGVVYANDGTEIAAEFSVNETEAGSQDIDSVVALANGGFAVSWSMYDSSTNEFILSTRVFDASGKALTDDITVATPSGDVYSTEYETVALSDGTFVVIWAEVNADWTEYTYKAQRVNADGSLSGDAEDILTPGMAGYPEAVEVENGVIQLSYAAYNADGELENNIATITFYNAPVDLALSSNTVSEDAAAGTVIGELSATDADGDTLTYALADDADGLFELVTENGVTKVALKGSLDYETAASHDVTVSVSDGEHTTTETFTISVGDVLENTAPTDITISNATLKESARVGFVVGTLSATDAEGDAITWSLESGQGNNDNAFSLVENDDGTVNVVLKSTLDHESSGGPYELVVTATDSNGAATTETISVTAEEEYFKLSSSPTGYNYLSVTEAAEKGQELGYVMQFDASFVPVSAKLTDDADGAFSIKTRVVAGETRYYLVTNKALDYEKQDSYSVTIEVENAEGETQEKTFEVQVLDAAETGDTARGNITIDANTLAAGENGGLNWDTYLDDYWAKLGYWLPNFSPSGTGGSLENASSAFYYSNGESVLSVEGSLAYIWNDPETGEDVHVVAGSITDLVFGSGSTTDGVTDAELTISGLDLESGTTPDNRLTGEVNLVASAFMHGPDEATPAEFAYVKSLLASYAQTFLGSTGADTYTGTIFGDTVKGNGGNDTFQGGGGGDALRGGGGADTIKGQGGADTLMGNGGADRLYGGKGADQFVFSAVSDSRGKTNDTIYDFAAADTIDLSGIDANQKKGDDQAFSFIGDDDFSRRAGELRFEKVKGDTVVEGDTNGDGKADFAFILDDPMKLKAEYFEL